MTDNSGHSFEYSEDVEEKLLEEQQFIQSIFQSLPDLLYAFDIDGNPMRWNEEFERVTGYTSDEIEAMHVTDFVPAAEIPTIADNLECVLSERGTATVESVIETKDGEHVPYELTGATFEDAEGNLRGVTGVGRDITDRKKRERQLESLNTPMRSLLNAETREEAAAIGVEAAQDILDLNANAIHLYDEDVDGLVPVAMTDAVDDLIEEPPTFTEGNSIAWRVYERGEPTAIDDVRDHPDRYNPDTIIRSELQCPLDEHGILIAGSPTPGAFDRQDQTLGELLAANITTAFDQIEREHRLRTREQELRRQNDRLNEFASIVSHDLRNPLSVAQGRLELAQEEYDSDHLDAIEGAHERMSTLIDDILTLAREGGSTTDVGSVALADMVEMCWRNVDTEAATLVTETTQVVRADESRLKQLIENLIRNALEHGGDDVTVTVGAVENGFYVEDDGPGIPPAEREQVFDAGYSTAADGTGFGLNIVEQVADGHSWEITVTSSADGGARFEFTNVDVCET